jgi:23S rRNA pseudouridine2605 synthase
VLQEGRNRQIRRMCEAIGLNVVRLHRVQFADITLSGCRAAGDWCFLTDEEIDLCRSVAAPRASGREQGAGDETERAGWQRRPPLRRDAESERRYGDAGGRGSLGRGSTQEYGRGARGGAAGSGQEQRMRSARITSRSARTTTTTWRRGAAAPVTESDRSRRVNV